MGLIWFLWLVGLYIVDFTALCLCIVGLYCGVGFVGFEFSVYCASRILDLMVYLILGFGDYVFCLCIG